MAIGIDFSLNSSVHAPSEDEPDFRELAASLVEVLVDARARKVCVLGFVGPNEAVTQIGTFAGDRLSDALQERKPSFTVLERQFSPPDDLSIQASTPTASDNASIQQLGQNLGADVAIGGAIRPDSEGFLLAVKVIRVEDEAVIAVREGRMQRSKFLDWLLQLWSRVPDFPVLHGGKDGVSYAQCIVCPTPSYSRAARAHKIQGTLALDVVILPDGHADYFRLLQGLGYGLDKAAIDAVSGWRFKPCEKDGKPVICRMAITVVFRLLN